jgi:hypothetical protein
LAASDFNCAIAEKSRVNEVADTVGAAAEELGLELLGVEAGVPLLPQAATKMPALKAMDNVTLFLVTRFKLTTSSVDMATALGADSREPPAAAAAATGFDATLGFEELKRS